MTDFAINKDDPMNDEKKAMLRKQFDAYGTPMPVKTPVDF